MSELNLHIGDCIHYGGHGVCRICGRETKTLGKECRDYFLLRPVGDDKTILYLPADAQPDRVKLRNVLSAGEIFQLVAREQDNPPSWISDCRERRQICGQTLRSGDAGALMHLVKNMYAHEQQMPSGKLLPISDQELLQSAENQLYNEFRFVLDIARDQVLPFILGQCQVYSLLKLFSRLLAYKDLCYIHTPLQQRLVGIVKKFLSACRKSGSSCLDDRSLTGMKLRNIVVGKERELY